MFHFEVRKVDVEVDSKAILSRRKWTIASPWDIRDAKKSTLCLPSYRNNHWRWSRSTHILMPNPIQANKGLDSSVLANQEASLWRLLNRAHHRE